MKKAENWGVIGHQSIIKYLKRAVERKAPAQAYLFYGQSHLGKTAVAEKFIAALLCSDGVSTACDDCPSCRQLSKGVHPDLFWVRQERDEKSDKLKKNISIEQVRGLKERLQMGSFWNSYKIAIIEEADKLSTDAANALLKILEEPASKVVIILLAEAAENMPLTVASRCEKLHFLNVGQKDIYDYLIQAGAVRDEAINLAQLSQGRPGLAITFFREPEFYHEYGKIVADFISFCGEKFQKKVKFIQGLAPEAKGMVESAANLKNYLNIWQSVARDLLFLKIDGEGETDLINLVALGELKKIARNYSVSQALNLVELIDQTARLLDQNVNPQLALENLLLAY